MSRPLQHPLALAALAAAFAFCGTALAHAPHGHGSGWQVPEAEILRDNPIPPDARSLARGQSLYRQHCVRCHGEEHRGDGPESVELDPPPADLIEHAPHHTDGDFAYRIREGRGPMPGFGGELSEREIWDLVNYLKDAAHLAALAAPSGGQAADGGHHHDGHIDGHRHGHGGHGHHH